MDLLKRRNDIAAQNKQAEKTRGSGWHPADGGVEARERAGELPLSERPIVLQDNDRILIVGPDVDAIKGGVSKWLEKLGAARTKAEERGWDDPDLLKFGLKYQANVMRHSKRLVGGGYGDAELTIPTQEWNYINQALAVQNIQIVSATAEVQNYDDV